MDKLKELFEKAKNYAQALIQKMKRAFIEKEWLKWVAIGVAAALFAIILLCSLTMCKGGEQQEQSSSIVSSSVESSESASVSEEDSSVEESSSDSSVEEEPTIPAIPEVPAEDKKKGKTTGFEYVYDEELGGLVLVSIGDYSAPCLEIPSTVIEYDDHGHVVGAKMVVAIGDGEKTMGYEELKYVIIPNTVQKINDNAFFGSINLHRVEFGERVTTIGVNAFRDCDNLETALFPEFEGWSVSVEMNGEDSIQLDAFEVEHHKNVCVLLTDDYAGMYWTRRIF